MTKRAVVMMFLVVLACLWLMPQAAQAQYVSRYRAWQQCNTPYPPGFCLEGYYGGYYPSYSYNRRYYPRGRGTLEAIAQDGLPIAAYVFGKHRGQDRGRREGYQAASHEAAAREARLLRELHEIRRQEAMEREQEQSREQQEPRDLISMTNTTDFPAIVYDDETEIARFQPHQTKRLPEPKEGYEAKIRTIIGNRVEWLPVRVRDNDSQSGWEIVFTGKK